MGMLRSSESTDIVSGFIVRTTMGNCLLVSSLLPSVDIVKGWDLILVAILSIVTADNSFIIAVALFLPQRSPDN
jgi:hypothetical protein